MFPIYPYINVNDLNLDWIVRHFNEFIADIADLKAWRATHEHEYEQLLEWQQQINAGDLPPAVYVKLVQWLQANAFDIIGEMVKFITVSLNDNGYICISFPTQWNALIFNTTGLDINTPLQPEYGHLTISY